MAKPLPSSSSQRGSAAGTAPLAPSAGVRAFASPEDGGQLDLAADQRGGGSPEEFEMISAENEQLRNLCVELEQALQEATQHADLTVDDRIKDLEALLGDKTQTIRDLHDQLQTAKTTIAEQEVAGKSRREGPAPREDDLLNLSEELERERRQLQDDEQTLMDQMREMEVSMARERAEMARQRNDLQRLQSEIRHELERLERNGALQSKIDGLKSKFQDATMRRGMAAGSTGAAAGQQPPPLPKQAQQAQQAQLPQKKDGTSLIGRLFGK
jgi:hypothetical protein